MKPFTVTPEAQAQARALGLQGDVTKELWEMYQRSTPFSHTCGNRRIDGLMLLVKDNTVLNVGQIEHDPVKEKHQRKAHTRLQRKQAREDGVVDLTLDT